MNPLLALLLSRTPPWFFQLFILIGGQTDISPKKTYRWLINICKDAQHHTLLEKCKSKPQWVSYSVTSVRMAIIRKSTNNKRWGGCGENGLPPSCSFSPEDLQISFGFFAGSSLDHLKVCSACKPLGPFPRSLLISNLIPLGYKTFFAWFEFN